MKESLRFGFTTVIYAVLRPSDPLVRNSLVVIAALFCATAPLGLSAQEDARTLAAVERLTPDLLAVRHDIHSHPELGNRETRTAALIAERLRALGLEVRTGVARTGVVGILRGGRPGPVVAVRADMDALPVTEQTDLPFASTVRTEYDGGMVGVAHVCGHDVHVTVALGVAATLSEMKAWLPGTVVFVFQPAEEGPPVGEEGGAALMLKEGLFPAGLEPAAMVALHSDGSLEVGTLGYTPGPAMASAQAWRATLIGKSAHGAAPDQSVDPVVMASQAVLALQTIRSRNLSPFTPSVVTIGVIRGGERRNIIPERVELSGTIRTFAPAVLDTIKRRMREILDGIAMSAGGRTELVFDEYYPVMVNDTSLTRRMAPALESVVGAGHVRVTSQRTGAEDFAYFADKYPGFYFRLGTRDPAKGSGGAHTPTFRADDGAIPIGVRAMTAVVLRRLDERAR
jgi:amidohydrolase